ncbi:hypothetical protein IV203_011698 [Nitzschia inconspicua]|uniref:Uncharacterized protein n=1 Tax=Nitzschia inconspicua TaxID=303405 RepID=A0A9K3KT02_9STRA|nr:hypothetical protein IV203_011698 [Nitzschia inconspicua]
MLAGPIGAMVLPLTDDAPKVTKEILGHALELTIHHPTIGPKICKKWITVDTIIDAIRAAAVIDASMGMNARLLNILLSKIQKYQLIDRFDGSNLSGFFRAKYSKQSYYIILPPGEQAEYPLFDKQWKEEVERVKSLISFRSLKSNDIPPVEHLLEQEKKDHLFNVRLLIVSTPRTRKVISMNVNKILTMFLCPRTRKVIAMNVNKILIMLICHGSNHRLTGFGREMSTDELQKVNEQRLNKTYWDGEAALEVLKSTSKPPLTASPFVRKLLIGINKEGYWNSNHMAVQFEDVVDCLKVLHPSHEFVFLFDHSQGHSRKRKGALDVNNMNVSFGVGDTQRMNWSNEEPPEESTEGPFNLSVQERRKRRSTQLLDEYVNNKPKTKKELTTDLQREGIISKEDRRGYTVKEMQKLAGDHGIAISKSEQKKITGWVGEPKGLLQVARERGLIDHNNHHLYSANPKKNPDGTLNDEKSLRSIVGQCTDFQNELTHLQVMANELKVQVMFTPKFHAEMAGEGIEYSWGFAKGSYRRKPLQKKRKRSDFEDLVDECTNVETELTKARIRKFSARARAYLCTYHYLATAEPTAAAIQDNDQEKKQKVPMMDEIERLMKKFKTHRCAFDFDRGFVVL